MSCMLLQALLKLYDSCVASGDIVPGWKPGEVISYVVDLQSKSDDPDVCVAATLTPVLAELDDSDTKKKKKPKLGAVLADCPVAVPRNQVPSPYFLYDKPDYALGCPDKDKKQQADMRHRAFVDYHHKKLDACDSSYAKVLLDFLDRFSIDGESFQISMDDWNVLKNTMWVTFRVNNVLLLKVDELKSYFTLADFPIVNSSFRVSCVSGKEVECVNDKWEFGLSPASFLNSTGSKAFISVNSPENPCFDSYGFTGCANAPIGVDESRKITQALYYLTLHPSMKDVVCRIQPDLTVLAWTEKVPSVGGRFAMNAAISQDVDVWTDESLKNVISSLSKGRPVEQLVPDTKFHMAGFIGSSRGINLMFYMNDTLESFAKHVNLHYDRFCVVRSHMPTVSRLMDNLIVKRGANTPSEKKLWVVLTRSVLFGKGYPSFMVQRALGKIRRLAVQDDNFWIADLVSVLKGYYLSVSRSEETKEVFTVELNSSSDVAYVLGQIFAVYEKIQSDVNPDLQKSLRSRFFNVASVTPSRVFAQLENYAQIYLDRISSKGSQVYYEKLLDGLMSKIEVVPDTLSVAEQAKFVLGYHHRKCDLYTKHDEKEKEVDGNDNNLGGMTK